jgi:hypothetical protein
MVAKIILLKASTTITKRKGDKGSPYLRSRELLKKPNRLPFTKTEKRTKEIQNVIQEAISPQKPHILNK